MFTDKEKPFVDLLINHLELEIGKMCYTEESDEIMLGLITKLENMSKAG